MMISLKIIKGFRSFYIYFKDEYLCELHLTTLPEKLLLSSNGNVLFLKEVTEKGTLPVYTL